MAETDLARWPDLLVMGLNLAALVAIGWYCSRKTDSADSYFLADRSMPGWIVAFSMMATIISSMRVKPFCFIIPFSFGKPSDRA